MNLNQYPAAIADLQRDLLLQDRHVRTLQESITELNGQIEAAIAFDSDLKNDSQRKAKRSELMASDDYKQRLSDLQIAQDERSELEIALELLRSEFSVAKLERREAIARLELQQSAA